MESARVRRVPRGGVTAAPRTAVIWSVLSQELDRHGRPLVVVDVGGGTGGFAVPLAEAGHEITVVDASPDALAALTRRADEAGVVSRIRAVQGDADDLPDLVPAGSADLALCHSLLEVVDDPSAVVASLAAVLRPGGAASVLVANRAAAVLSRALSGHLSTAVTALTDDDGRLPGADPLRRRYDLTSATGLLAQAGLQVEQAHGVRVVTDLVPGGVLDGEPGVTDALLTFELAAASKSPYRDIATQLHLFARRTEASAVTAGSGGRP